MRAIGFFYDWSGRRKLDPYFAQVADAFASLGIALDIVFANELIHPEVGLEGWTPFLSRARLGRFVATSGYDFVFSVNNAGLTAELEARTDRPIVSWLVDDTPHLFFHDGPDAEPFGARRRLVCYSSTLARHIQRRCPARGRVPWVSHGTNLDPLTISSGSGRPLDISFVGSAFRADAMADLLKRAGILGAAGEVLDHLARVRDDYVAAIDTIVPGTALAGLLRRRGMSVLDYRRFLSDVITMQDRATDLAAVADLGLRLFGNDAWLDTINVTPRLAGSYAFDERVSGQAQLVGVYARSRIAVNVPNVQNGAGLAARVFDIMASPALLVTRWHPESDLHALFGADCPVPMYRDAADLRRLCEHHLAHERERRELVARCNALIVDRFAVPAMLSRVLQAGGIVLPPSPAPARSWRTLPTERFAATPRPTRAYARASAQVLRALRRRVRDRR